MDKKTKLLSSAAACCLFSAEAASATAVTPFASSIYFVELVVFGLLAVAIIFLLVSMNQSKKALRQTIAKIRDEIVQERFAVELAMESIKKKEDQINQLAHLLQSHIESQANAASDVSTKISALNEEEDELVVEVLDER